MKFSSRSRTEWTVGPRAVKRLLVGLVVAVCGLAGCKPAAEPPAAGAAAPKPSAAEELLDSMTGKTTVEAGQRAKKQIREINEASARRVEEF